MQLNCLLRKVLILARIGLQPINESRCEVRLQLQPCEMLGYAVHHIGACGDVLLVAHVIYPRVM